jgi:hypothetical protein
VTNCARLKFTPKFSVSVSGKNSKAGGAALTAKVSYPTGPWGAEANIHSVKVELPKQLPSRLTTLQKACLAATFDKDPAACPPESFIGHAKVSTPALPAPLEGPAIFVSHGGEAFPDLTIILKGSGVTVDLVGTTFISKSGITSTTFKSTPDVPFSSFEINLPQGRYSALGANADLCATAHTTTTTKTVTRRIHGKKRRVKVKVKHTASGLFMPTEFKAQNGAEIRQKTPISVTGCPKDKTKKRNRKHHRRR